MAESSSESRTSKTSKVTGRVVKRKLFPQHSSGRNHDEVATLKAQVPLPPHLRPL